MKKFSIASLFFLSACMVGPDHTDPQVTMPEKFAEVADVSGMEGEEADLSTWWKQFNDPLLDELIGEALIANYDLLVAVEKIRELRAIHKMDTSQFFPQINAFGLATRTKASENMFGAGFFSGLITNLFQLGFDASWELDFFGKTRRMIESASYDVKGQVETARDVQITVIGEVARSYIDIRGYQERIQVTRDHIEVQADLLDLAESRFEAGLTAETEMQQAKAALEENLAALPILESSLAQTIYGLAVLLGRQPESLEGVFDEDRYIPVANAKVPVGLPSDLLRRRPDIRQAEDALDSARALIGVAKADLFPSFSLTGQNNNFPVSYGYNSNTLNKWLKPGSIAWTIGPMFNWSIFDAGSILANIRAQTSRQKQALLEYEKTVLLSLQDVESALVAYYQENLREASLQEEVAANRRVRDLTIDLYYSGLVNLSDVLDQEAIVYTTEDTWIQSKEALMTDLVALYKALGGGWECSYSP